MGRGPHDVDGSLDDRDFVAYYHDGERVVAACGVGRDRAMAAFHALMMTDGAPALRTVRDGFDPLAALGQA